MGVNQNKLFQVKALSFILIAVFLIAKVPIIDDIEDFKNDRLVNSYYVTQGQEEIVLVIFGEKSVNTIGKWPIDRSIYGEMIEKYFYDSKSVVVDFLFPDESENDSFFASAMEENSNVFLAYVDTFDGQDLKFPTFELLESAHDIGYVNYLKDEDGYTRKYSFLYQDESRISSSLVHSVLDKNGYKLVTDKNVYKVINEATNEVVFNGLEVENSSQLTFDVFQTELDDVIVYEAIDIINGHYPSDEFSNKIIIVGGSFAGSSDTINTPVTPRLGVKFIYDSMNTLLSGVKVIEVHYLFEILITLLLCAMLDIIIMKKKPFYSAVITLITLLALTMIQVIGMRYLLISFKLVHMLTSITVNYLIFIVIKLTRSDASLSKLNASLDEIFSMNDMSLDSLSFSSYMEMIESQLLYGHGIALKGTYTEIEYVEYSNTLHLPKKIYIEGKEVIIPLKGINESLYVVFVLEKQRDIKELNYLLALVTSSYAFYSKNEAIETKNQMYMSIFKSLVSAIDAKDPITSNHSLRVADISLRIGQLLGYSEEAKERLYFAGLLHDVGKIGIPESVLHKPCFYSASDFDIMKKHPLLGVEILHLEGIDEDIKSTILQHHERIDGKGYPEGLIGSEISEFSKIVKIADVYDALSSKRQYKEAWNIYKVCKILRDGSGTEYDGKIVNMFIDDLLRENDIEEHSNLEDSEESKENLKLKATNMFVNCKEKLEEIGNDYSTRSRRPNTIELSINRPITIDGLSLGESFTTRKWLNNLPIHFEADNINEFDYYFNDYSTSTTKTIFVFYRSYLNATFMKSCDSNLITQLELLYGQEFVIDNGRKVWDNKELYIILEENTVNDFELLILHKYCITDR